MVAAFKWGPARLGLLTPVVPGPASAANAWAPRQGWPCWDAHARRACAYLHLVPRSLFFQGALGSSCWCHPIPGVACSPGHGASALRGSLPEQTWHPRVSRAGLRALFSCQLLGEGKRVGSRAQPWSWCSLADTGVAALLLLPSAGFPGKPGSAGCCSGEGR